MLRNHIIYILALVLSAASLSSCGASKNAVQQAQPIQYQNAAGEPVQTRFDQLIQSYKPWQSIYVPATINIDSPRSMSVSARLTMVRDSLIHISLRMLGMEIAIVHITPDQVYVVDKYHKYIFNESLSRLMARYPVTLANVQDILLGRIFVAGKDSVSVADSNQFKLSADEDSNIWMAYPSTKIEDATWHFNLTSSPLCVQTLTFFRNDNTVSIRYSDIANTEVGTLPAEVGIRAPIKSFTAEASIMMKPSGAKFDEHVDFDWQAPAGYTQLSFEQIKRMFSF